MPRLFTRETFIALRARRTAHKIASDILNPHIEVRSVPCHHCGQDVPLPADDLNASIHCPSCGKPTLVPGNYLVEDKPTLDDHAPNTPNPLPPWTVLQCLGAVFLAMALGMALLLFVLAVIE